MLRRILFIGVAAAVVWGCAQADGATERKKVVYPKAERRIDLPAAATKMDHRVMERSDADMNVKKGNEAFGRYFALGRHIYPYVAPTLPKEK